MPRQRSRLGFGEYTLRSSASGSGDWMKLVNVSFNRCSAKNRLYRGIEELGRGCCYSER